MPKTISTRTKNNLHKASGLCARTWSSPAFANAVRTKVLDTFSEISMVSTCEYKNTLPPLILILLVSHSLCPIGGNRLVWPIMLLGLVWRISAHILPNLSVCLSNLSVCLPVYLSVCLSVCPFVCLSACPFVCLSVCPFVCLPVHLSVCLSLWITPRFNSFLFLFFKTFLSALSSALFYCPYS
jgi:hypothetical protein